MPNFKVSSIQRNIQRYPCNDELCKGDHCVCIYHEQPWCETIKYDDRQEDISKPKEERDKYMTDPKVFICTDEVFKGNDCVCSSEEQPLCKDVGCKDPKEGRCITIEECGKCMTTSKGYICTDDSDSIHTAKLSSNELLIFLRGSKIERSPTIKASCKNIMCNNKYSV